MWLLFSFLSALTQGTYQAVSKRFTKDLSPYFLASGSFFIASPFLLGYALLGYWPALSADFYIASAITASLNVIATILFLKAVASVDLSLASPIIALTPVFNLFTSYLILGEAPQFFGAVGVVIIVLGLIVVTHKHRRKDDFAIEAETKKQKWGIIFLFSVSLIYSISSNYDKVVAINSPLPFGVLFTSALVGVVILFIGISKGDCRIFREKKNFLKSIFLGMILLVASAVWYLALSGGLVVYSIAIKRLSVFVGIIYGYFWFKEKNIRQRLFGALVVLAGIFLILFFK